MRVNHLKILSIVILPAQIVHWACRADNHKPSEVISGTTNNPREPAVDPEEEVKAIDNGVDATGDIAGGNGALWATDCLPSEGRNYAVPCDS